MKSLSRISTPCPELRIYVTPLVLLLLKLEHNIMSISIAYV
jgi:hypothetical protein